MTHRQLVAIRLPIGSTVECVDSSPLGNGHLLRSGHVYTIKRHEQGVDIPLVALQGLNGWFASVRFRRISL